MVRHGGRADAFEQGRHRRGVAQARAVIDVVAAKAGAHQLLEQIGFFVCAFGGAKTGQGVFALGVANRAKFGGSEVERFVPGRFAENFRQLVRVHREIA